MKRKIDKNTLEHIRQLCFQKLHFELNNNQNRCIAKDITENYLNSNEFQFKSVKCDLENNSPSVVDNSQMLIDIFEEENSNSANYFKHRIIL